MGGGGGGRESQESGRKKGHMRDCAHQYQRRRGGGLDSDTVGNFLFRGGKKGEKG